MPKKNKKNHPVRKTTLVLRCTLTPEKRTEYLTRLSELDRTLDEMATQRKEWLSDWRASVTIHREERREILDVLHRGVECDVQCEERLVEGRVQVTRLDTSEVWTREPTHEDRQRQIGEEP